MRPETCAQIEIKGEALLGDPAGALYWPREDILIVSDLHFEKGSSFAAKGQMLPPYDTRATLKALAAAIEVHAPARVIALGDSFHDTDAGARIAQEDMEVIQRLAKLCDWIWITGNHDEILPTGIGGRVTDEFSMGSLRFRHEPSSEDGEGEICGHLHPCAIVRTRSRRLRRRCFVGDGRRLILPAFGAFTGGLDIADEAYDNLFEGSPTAWVLGKERVYTIPSHRLVGVV